MWDFLNRAADVLGQMTVIATAVGALWLAVKRPWRGASSWFIRVNQAIGQVSVISQALGPNGGESLGDLIRSTAEGTAEMGVRVNWLFDQMERPNYECDPHGLCVRINAKFTDHLGYSPIEMMGNKWVRLVHPEDRERVMEEWRYAIKDCRIFESVFRAVTRGGVVIRIRAIAEPHVHPSTGRILRWQGRIETLAPVEAPPNPGCQP